MPSIDPSPPCSQRPCPPFPSPPRVSCDLRMVLLSVFLPVTAALALPALGIGALIWWRASKTWDYRERWSGTWLMAAVGLVVYALIIWFGHPLLYALFGGLLSASPVAGPQRLGLLWLLHLCFAPTCALILEGLYPLTRRVCLLPRYPVQSPALEPLGTCLGGDLYEWVYGNQLCIPLEALRLHGVVLGEPGYGKTITLLRLATIAVRYGMQVIFLDLKGSKQTSAQFVAAMRYAGVGRIRVYPQEAYDGWRGDAAALYNRLMALVDPGIHPYYARVDSALISLAVHAPCGPPRSSQDLLLRLDAGWLRRAYAGRRHWYEQRKIRKVAPQIDATSLAFEGFFDAVNGGLDGTFAFEDGDAVYIGLDGSALKEQAASIGRYLLEECAHYATYRKQAGMQVLMIIDEFGVLKTSNATSLYERVREAGMAMWASAQSYQGLGPERARILSASSIKLLHRCGDPEEVVKYAGMRDQPAFTQLIDGEEDMPLFPGSQDIPKKRTSVRMQRAYAMPIEEVQQLSRGTIALITGGLGAWCQVYPLALPPELMQAATAFVAARLASQPADAAAPLSPHSSTGHPRGQMRPSGQGQEKKQSTTAPSQGTHHTAVLPLHATSVLMPRTPKEPADDSPVDF